jgi:hypothetical protein
LGKDLEKGLIFVFRPERRDTQINGSGVKIRLTYQDPDPVRRNIEESGGPLFATKPMGL